MNPTFDMVAKTFRGLEEVLAEELRQLGAQDVMPGNRMVSFRGDKAMLYKANMWCRTALRILKPFYTFKASDPDTLYDRTKAFDWSSLMNADKTFSIDSTVYSEEFRNSQFVTYRVKDAIVDWFRDHEADEKRPRVRLDGADIMLNVHISGRDVTLSLDSSGESLHKRGWRRQQTEAPINEVLAAGIILKSGWRGDCPLVDPMCGSGTFLIEAAMIATGTHPGIYRRRFAFESWPDFDAELFDSIYNDDSQERTFTHRIIGADISPKAIAIARENIKSAGMMKYIDLEVKPLARWEEAPVDGVLITNPPYGERISVDDMEGLYALLGRKLKHVFGGYHAWIIGYREEYFHKIGLAPSVKMPLLNGSLECELREYIIFDGNMRDFRSEGGKLKGERAGADCKPKFRYKSDEKWAADARRSGMGGKEHRSADKGRKLSALEERYHAGNRQDRKKDRKERREISREEFSENPLARRRNEAALKSLIGRKPSLPKSEGPMMRPRRGWKRPGAQGNQSTENDNNE